MAMNRLTGPGGTGAPGARPLGATLAAAVLTALGGGLAVIALGQLARDPVPPAAPGDEVTALLDFTTTVLVLAFVVAMLSVVAVHAYAAVRIWVRARWAWVEGLFAVPMGAIAYFGVFGVDENLEPTLTVGLIVAACGYVFVVVALLLVRDWFEPISLSPDRSDRPWWLRTRRF